MKAHVTVWSFMEERGKAPQTRARNQRQGSLLCTSFFSCQRMFIDGIPAAALQHVGVDFGFSAESGE